MTGPGLDLIGEEEIEEVLDVLRSRRLGRYGPDDATFPAKVRKFEKQIQEEAQVDYALAVSSGTAALYLSLVGLGVGPGDEVIVPGFTYIASIAAIVHARARPVLAEIDGTFNLDPIDVEAKIGPRTKAILLVHMLGNPGRIRELKEIAKRHGIALIEDAAQAFGASYQGKWVGGHGDAGIYSFNQMKTITCGDGGMLVTNDEELYRACFALHDQGHSPNRVDVTVGDRPFLGFNFRMIELQGAVLLAQLRRLPGIVAHLQRTRDTVYGSLKDIPGLSFRELEDPGGDAATHFVLCFPDDLVARDVAAELGAITLDKSGWHVYSRMEAVLMSRTINETGCPFSCASTDDRPPPDYRAGMLPHTDGLLARSISIGVGVVDPNLAPVGFGMKVQASEVEERALKLREVIQRHLS